MSEVTYVEWQPEIETPLPTLEALWNDIWDARITAKEVIRAFDEQRSYPIAQQLGVAALISYFRAFKSGRRKRLQLDEGNLPDDLRQAHDRLEAIRDKHVAHPVNKYEAHHINVAVANIGTPHAKVTQVSTSTSGILPLSGPDLAKLIELSDFWLAHIESKKEPEEKRLLAYAQTLSAEELNALRTDYKSKLDENPFKQRQ